MSIPGCFPGTEEPMKQEVTGIHMIVVGHIKKQLKLRGMKIAVKEDECYHWNADPAKSFYASTWRFAFVKQGLGKWDKVIGWVEFTKTGEIELNWDDPERRSKTAPDTSIPLSDPHALAKCVSTMVDFAKKRLATATKWSQEKLKRLAELQDSIKE